MIQTSCYNATMERREKTSIGMTLKVRRTLDRLKQRVRDAGVPRSIATDSAIIEVLILTANFEELQDYLSR